MIFICRRCQCSSSFVFVIFLVCCLSSSSCCERLGPTFEFLTRNQDIQIFKCFDPTCPATHSTFHKNGKNVFLSFRYLFVISLSGVVLLPLALLGGGGALPLILWGVAAPLLRGCFVVLSSSAVFGWCCPLPLPYGWRCFSIQLLWWCCLPPPPSGGCSCFFVVVALVMAALQNQKEGNIQEHRQNTSQKKT